MSIASEIQRITQNVSDSLDAVATKGVVVPSGSNSDDLASLILQIPTGSGSAIVITDEQDEHGGIIRHINAVSLNGDTVTAASLLQGYTAHDARGNAIVGTASSGTTPTGTINITTNGTHDVTNYASANVNVPTSSEPNLQAKTGVAPTESSQTITPDSGYDGLSSVQIDAVSSTYVGTDITRRSSIDLTASGATVTVPAGYYAEQASKSVASGAAGTPTATKGTVSNHSVTVTPSVTNTTGYISGGTKTGTAVSVSASELVSGTLSVDSSGTKDVTNYASVSVPTGTVTAPSSISGTSASVNTATNTITLNKTISVTPNVSTAGYITSGTAGNTSVSLTASITTKAAATITPAKNAQTISGGTYLTGTQTIAAIPEAYQDVTSVDATASDVVSGKKIVNSSGTVVTGTLTFQTIYSGSSAPSSSTGVNGDIYIQTGG